MFLISAVNSSSFKTDSDPIFFRLELLLPTSFHDLFNSSAKPKRTKRIFFQPLKNVFIRYFIYLRLLVA